MCAHVYASGGQRSTSGISLLLSTLLFRSIVGQTAVFFSLALGLQVHTATPCFLHGYFRSPCLYHLLSILTGFFKKDFQHDLQQSATSEIYYFLSHKQISKGQSFRVYLIVFILFFKVNKQSVMVTIPIVSVLGRWRKENQQLKASLSYIVSKDQPELYSVKINKHCRIL